ncbi:ATP-grasp domain-containing protein [Butyrivibrio sp. VCB2006]|uniref:ATP-grasp domain-containing protein n=1 Tax=Butyrivibrio sp. VCB2006 TaxID=1280679 RepID=UPI000401091B|nr:ATP-grasp domain-containing protein [Butyrivibrio sp. VCB2006]
MKKIAIIGASYLQAPLILKAKEMGLETHVFAWKAGDIGETLADFFYPISIIEKEEILDKCKQINVDGICSIASDLAVVTVNYVAQQMNLVGNSQNSTLLSTNKHLMREAFAQNNDPSPRSIMVNSIKDINCELSYPVIVKPLDRSGSRGIVKVYDPSKLDEAIETAEEQGFIKKALVEEFVEGNEYSVECVSWKGHHTFLAMTKKYTTGSPNFIETGHIQPSGVDEQTINRVKEVVSHALDSLQIKNGASHSELKIDSNGNIVIIEIGARMGGDFIGSTLVHYSTGIDFVKAVINIALGEEPSLKPDRKVSAVGIHYICTQEDIDMYNRVSDEHPEYLVEADIPDSIDGEIKDSATRHGYFIMAADSVSGIEKYMPIIME